MEIWAFFAVSGLLIFGIGFFTGSLYDGIAQMGNTDLENPNLPLFKSKSQHSTEQEPTHIQLKDAEEELALIKLMRRDPVQKIIEFVPKKEPEERPIQNDTTTKRVPDEIKDAVEAERLRIKRALHDDTIQRITAIKFKFEFFQMVPPGNDIAKQYGDNILNDLECTINAIRFFIEDLEDEDIAEKTFIILLRDLQAKLALFFFMRVFIYENQAESTFPLTTREKTELLYIVKEALQNAIKYSTTNHFHIYIIWQPDGLVVETEASGFGLDPYGRKGYGFDSMKERANAIGASIFAESRRNRGVFVKTFLPKSTLAHSDEES